MGSLVGHVQEFCFNLWGVKDREEEYLKTTTYNREYTRFWGTLKIFIKETRQVREGEPTRAKGMEKPSL